MMKLIFAVLYVSLNNNSTVVIKRKFLYIYIEKDTTYLNSST